MNVGELKELLSQYPDEMEVLLAQPTHNHWRQTAAVAVNEGTTSEEVVEYSDYLQSDMLIETDDNGVVVETDKTRRVLLISN